MDADRVIVRSDHDYLGEPRAFYWQDQYMEVDQVLSRKHTPSGYSFRVRNEHFGIFELVYDLNADQWSVQQL